jgi:hypothetical protein
LVLPGYLAGRERDTFVPHEPQPFCSDVVGGITVPVEVVTTPGARPSWKLKYALLLGGRAY